MSEQNKWSRKRQLQDKMAKIGSSKAKQIAVDQSATDSSVVFESNANRLDQPGPSHAAEIHHHSAVVPHTPDESLLCDDSEFANDTEAERDLDDPEGDDTDSEYDFSNEDAQEMCRVRHPFPDAI